MEPTLEIEVSIVVLILICYDFPVSRLTHMKDFWMVENGLF